MTDPEGHDVGHVRLDGHEVVGDDGHVVAVDREALDPLGAAVDQPQAVLLPGVELELGEARVRRAGLAVGDQGAVVVHLAVDQIVVRERRGPRGRLHDLFDNLEILRVVMIAEQHRSDVVIIGHLRRAVNDHGSHQTGGVLGAVVRVIPRSPVEIREE